MKKVRFLLPYLSVLVLILWACGKDDPAPTPPPPPVAPSNLNYSTNTLTTCQGSTTSSVKPTVTGTSPLTYQISAMTPSNNPGISIDGEGKINIAANATSGTFKISVKVTNSAGNQTFTDIYTVTVNNADPNGVNFDDEVLTLVTAKCAPCHTTGSQSKWNDYNTAKASINSMISRTKNGSMPQGGPALTAQEIKVLEDWAANCLIK
jgi:hypothetical protein